MEEFGRKMLEMLDADFQLQGQRPDEFLEGPKMTKNRIAHDESYSNRGKEY